MQWFYIFYFIYTHLIRKYITIDIEDKYTSMTSLDDYFFKVDKNMIVVDPIPHGLLCLSGIEIDTLFPLFITKKGNASFVKSKPKQFYAKIAILEGFWPFCSQRL